MIGNESNKDGCEDSESKQEVEESAEAQNEMVRIYRK